MKVYRFVLAVLVRAVLLLGLSLLAVLLGKLMWGAVK